MKLKRGTDTIPVLFFLFAVYMLLLMFIDNAMSAIINMNVGPEHQVIDYIREGQAQLANGFFTNPDPLQAYHVGIWGQTFLLLPAPCV